MAITIAAGTATVAGVPTTVSLDEFVASAMNKYATAPAPYFEPSEGAEPVAPVAPLVLKSGEEAYGKLFGGVPKSMRDFAVRKFSDVSEEMLHLSTKNMYSKVGQKLKSTNLKLAVRLFW